MSNTPPTAGTPAVPAHDRSCRETAAPRRHAALAPDAIVLMSDPRATAIPVTDCGAPLVDVRGTLLVDDRRADTTGSYAHLRRCVLDRLDHAQALLPDGLRLLFVEGYRPPDLQRLYFEKYADELRAANPAWSGEQVHQAASRYVSPPEIAPHSAGAAVDLTLVDADGTELDMGTRVNAGPEESDGACYTDAASISPQARANRTLPADALSAAALVNYPTEWWHWSYGDRYWALTVGRPACLNASRISRIAGVRAARPTGEVAQGSGCPVRPPALQRRSSADPPGVSHPPGNDMPLRPEM